MEWCKSLRRCHQGLQTNQTDISPLQHNITQAHEAVRQSGRVQHTGPASWLHHWGSLVCLHCCWSCVLGCCC
jgi:hypothetical protein